MKKHWRELVVVAIWLGVIVNIGLLAMRANTTYQSEVVLVDHAKHQCWAMKIENEELVGKRVTCPGSQPPVMPARRSE